MRKKLSLESLTVDSFPTTADPALARGTVRGNEGIVDPQPTPPVYGDDCTCNGTCLCRTAAYYCATVMATVVSCHYTYNVSCAYDTYNDSCRCDTYAGCESIDICAVNE
jgi:hypothetical protein